MEQNSQQPPEPPKRGGGGDDGNGGGGGEGNSGGGGEGGGVPPRTEEAGGLYYSPQKRNQVEERGRTPEDIASLPYRALWTADSVDRLRGGPAAVYYDSGQPNQYVVYNATNGTMEVVAMSNLTKPDFIVDDAINNRRTTFGAAMKRLLGFGSKEHHQTRHVGLFNAGPRKSHRVAGLRTPTHLPML